MHFVLPGQIYFVLTVQILNVVKDSSHTKEIVIQANSYSSKLGVLINVHSINDQKNSIVTLCADVCVVVHCS